MKRHLTALVLLLLTAAAATAQFRYSPVAGVTINDLKFKEDLFAVTRTVGGQAGVQGELMFPGIGFGIDFGLLYTLNGSKADIGSRKMWAVDGFGNENLMLHTLQIPFHLRFKWTRMNGIEDYIAPFVSGGPDFIINAGHSAVKGNAGADNPFSYAGAALGLSCGGGVELWKRWQVSVQYTWGMTYSLKTVKLDNMSARSSFWTARLAYFF